jgi:hypothetical protein
VAGDAFRGQSVSVTNLRLWLPFGPAELCAFFRWHPVAPVVLHRVMRACQPVVTSSMVVASGIGVPGWQAVK